MDWVKSSRCSAATCVEAAFVKSSASLNNGTCVEAGFVRSSACADSACVEAAPAGGTVLVRDSKDLNIAPLAFPREAWHAFLDGVQAGEFPR